MNFFRRIYSFDYMGHKKWWFTISAIIIGAGLISLFVKGGGNPLKGLNYGLEFKEGTRIAVVFTKPAALGDVRAVVTAQGHPDAVIQQVSDVVRRRRRSRSRPARSRPRSRTRSRRRSTSASPSTRRAGWNLSLVGATFGHQVVSSSLKAIVIALLLILGYVTFRFQWKFAVGAIAAEVHDLLVVVGIYSLTGREVTTATIAAVLTILGYSLYDTVIVFDRIRENQPKLNRIPYGDMVNVSIWETLTRSINTTMITLLPVVCLLLFGGATLKDFAFALLVGILSGAYSSIFVASPITTLLKEREPQYRKLKLAARPEKT